MKRGNKRISSRKNSKHLRSKIEKDPNDLGPTQVAAMIGETYQRARNLMLKKKMGDVKYDEETRKLSVRRDGVQGYLKSVGNE